MPVPSDNVRIRKGLTFLNSADRRAINAAVLLQKLLGYGSPQGPGALMKPRVFSVAGTTYKGRMTDGQYNFLKGYQSTKKAFADAIAKVILKLASKSIHALKDIDEAITMSSSAAKVANPTVALGGIVIPPIGCCTYDGGMRTECTEAVCIAGLAGMWVNAPCKPGSTRSR